MDKASADKLVEALLSEKFTQTKNTLRGDDGFCCLGVACEISGLSSWVEEEAGHVGVCHNTYLRSYAELPLKVQRQYGFYSPTGARADGGKLKIGEKDYNDIASANDAGESFRDIAEYITENYEDL